MKRSCLLPLLLAICLALCGCTTVVCNGPEYRLLKENGSYYIQFHTDYSHEKYNASLPEDGSRPPFYPTYTTAAELREALLSGNAPYYYLAGLNAKAATAPLEILDPERLYDVRLPAGLSVESVRWEGSRYVFSVTDTAMASVEVSVLSQGEYGRVLAEQYQNGGCDTHSTTLSFEQNGYRNSKKLRYCIGTGYDTEYYAAFLYEFETAGGVRYVCETSRLGSKNGDVFPESNSGLSAPGYEPVVHMLWTDGEGYFWVKATLKDMFVTDLWLNSFQMIPTET